MYDFGPLASSGNRRLLPGSQWKNILRCDVEFLVVTQEYFFPLGSTTDVALIHQNIQGMVIKELEIELFTGSGNIDVLCITEHGSKNVDYPNDGGETRSAPKRRVATPRSLIVSFTFQPPQKMFHIKKQRMTSESFMLCYTTVTLLEL
ncbi:hypothetical protein EVAR_45637_1 [Eumeta japonica]|uniref:Uncharacterized protein n=1 Tax=Eumeta variegata TaxID=151549 RepID=A0A4C1WGF0_EUMVA|nr:hypothetical protein EVAR_45637_1 [Eumeta japonica]